MITRLLSEPAPVTTPQDSTDTSESAGFLQQALDKINVFLEWAGPTFQLILNIIGIIVAILVITLMSRYIIRYAHNFFRRLINGNMVFNEVVYEGVIGDGPRSIDLMNNMRNLMFESRNGLETYFSRPRVSIIIRNSDEDDAVHMYVGVSEKHYDESRMRTWASGMNCSLEPIQAEDIGIVTAAPMIAVMERAEAANITDQPQNSTIGQVVSRVQEMMNNGVGGTLMLTFEPMRKSEGDLLINHVTGAAIKAGGDQMALDQGPRKTSIVTSNRPSRAVMAAFSDNGDTSLSNSLVNMAISNMSNIGWSLTTSTPARRHMRQGWMALPGSLFLLFLSLINGFPLIISLIITALNISVIIGLPWFSSFWIALDAKKGAMAIPPFWRYSLRRIFHQHVLKVSKLDLDSGQLGRNYVARPSMREVFPMYQTSVMQFASMPTTGIGAVNLASTAVPQVPMAASVLQEIDQFVQTGDIVYSGMSVKSNDPVYRTVKDINFGIALGGDAGSGKTNALMNDFYGICRLSRKKDGIAGKMTINPMWFETKTDDVDKLSDMVKKFDPLIIKVHDPESSSRLALEGPRITDPGTTVQMIQENVSLLIDAMEAIWGGGSFGPRSRQIASAALTMTMLLKEEEIKHLFMDRIPHPERPNVIKVMGMIVGTDPSIDIETRVKEFAQSYGEILSDPEKKKIRQIITGMTKDEAKLEITRRRILQVSMDSMVNMYKVRDAVSPLQNKLPQLSSSEGLFETYTMEGNLLRDEYSVDKFISYGGPVIIDMTPAGSLTRRSSEMFVMMIHYLTWQRLQKIAGGFAKQGKFTPIYADEVTNFTGKKDSDAGAGCTEIIAEVREQGRSYGVSHNVGFQNFIQMPERVRSAVLSFQSLFFLQFTNQDDVRIVLNNMGSNPRYTVDNIPMFPQGIGIAKMTINGVKREAFTIKTPYIGTWVKALDKAKGNVSDAFDRIQNDEISHIRRERKKKVDVVPAQVTQETNVTDDYWQDQDDDVIPLSWE